MKIIKRGAEAILYLENDHLVKERIKKSYRLSQIDEKLRKFRTRKEAKLISRAKRCGVETPNIVSVDENNFKINMDFIDGNRLKEFFNETNEENKKKVAEELGKKVGLLHNHGIVHGDLTTSNMILKDNKIFFIDFGLGEFSRRIENQAVDLSVLKEAFKSTHFKHLNLLWENFIKGYKQTNDNFNKVLDTLNDIEKRGRYVKR
ncbi:MAG: Kae1-associated serine/threonine protein kinase [Candidatus Aenigmarchaeota archaeon]|nr:Kae1-associated serine/threonine protein kinase [Candidatus Aenigmarchaeota archaeon]